MESNTTPGKPDQQKNASKRSHAQQIPKTPTKSESSQGSFSPAASPPRKLLAPSQLEQDLIAGKRDVSNLALGHAIAFETEKDVSAPGFSGIHLDESHTSKAVEEMRINYWKDIQYCLNSSQNWIVLVHPISDIKEELKDLLPKRRITQLHADLNDKLDLEILRNQVKNKTFGVDDVRNITCLIIDIMSKVCAPVRDVKIDELRGKLGPLTLESVSDIFIGIVNLLQGMKMDMANFSIQSIRPLIKQQQVEYERRKMMEYIKQHPTNGLIHTKHWLTQSFYNLMDEQKSAKDSDNPVSPIGPNRILDQAFFHLLNHPPQKSETNFYPETVLLDRQKFSELNLKKRNLTKLAGLLIISGGIIHKLRFTYSQSQGITGKIKKDVLCLLEGETTQNSENIKIYISDLFEKYKKDGDTLGDKFKALISEIVPVLEDENHRVRIICKKRIIEYIDKVCEHTTANQYRLNGNKSPIPDIPKSLHIISSEVAVLAAGFTNLVILNKTIHGPFYSGLIKEIYAEFNSNNVEPEKTAEKTAENSVQKDEPVFVESSTSVSSGSSGSCSPETVSKHVAQVVPMTPRKQTELKVLNEEKRLERSEETEKVRQRCARSLRFDDVD